MANLDEINKTCVAHGLQIPDYKELICKHPKLIGAHQEMVCVLNKQHAITVLQTRYCAFINNEGRHFDMPAIYYNSYTVSIVGPPLNFFNFFNNCLSHPYYDEVVVFYRYVRVGIVKGHNDKSEPLEQLQIKLRYNNPFLNSSNSNTTRKPGFFLPVPQALLPKASPIWHGRSRL
jgi:hypothetical protein